MQSASHGVCCEYAKLIHPSTVRQSHEYIRVCQKRMNIWLMILINIVCHLPQTNARTNDDAPFLQFVPYVTVAWQYMLQCVNTDLKKTPSDLLFQVLRQRRKNFKLYLIVWCTPETIQYLWLRYSTLQKSLISWCLSRGTYSCLQYVCQQMF